MANNSLTITIVIDLAAASAAYKAILDLVSSFVLSLANLLFFQQRASLLHTLENATELVVSRLLHKKNAIASPRDLRQVMILLEVTPLIFFWDSCIHRSLLFRILC